MPARRSVSIAQRSVRHPRGRDDEQRLTADIVELARQYGRYGYRRIAAMLRTTAGWVVNDKRVERIWRREGLKVPAKQPKRGRLWLAEGSCIRLRPERRNHVWSYDFVEDRTHDGRKYRMLNMIDEFTRECLAIRVARRLKAIDVIDVLSDLFILRGVPGHIRSDNGPEFVAKGAAGVDRRGRSQDGLHRAGVSPGRTATVETFNGKLRDELLNGEIFYRLKEAKIIIESWRRHYNTIRPHSSLGYRPPAPEVFIPALAAWPSTPPRPARRPRSLCVNQCSNKRASGPLKGAYLKVGVSRRPISLQNRHRSAFPTPPGRASRLMICDRGRALSRRGAG